MKFLSTEIDIPRGLILLIIGMVFVIGTGIGGALEREYPNGEIKTSLTTGEKVLKIIKENEWDERCSYYEFCAGNIYFGKYDSYSTKKSFDIKIHEVKMFDRDVNINVNKDLSEEQKAEIQELIKNYKKNKLEKQLEEML